MAQNKIILITGCQRSGTTLLNLVLDSHPDIHGIDELEISQVDVNRYQTDPVFHPCVSLKLPAVSHELRFFKSRPDIKILWCIRDPRAVVASMLTLTLPLDGASIPWIAHPAGGGREIQNAVRTLMHRLARDVAEKVRTFNQVNLVPVAERTRDSDIFCAALCWRLKHELLECYLAENLPLRVVQYERLVANPEHELRNVVDYLGLCWSPDLLNHHRLHTGMSVGGTENTRPIDTKSAEKWESTLSAQDLDVIRRLCSAPAEKRRYDLS